MSYGNKVDSNHAELRDEVFRKLCKQVIDCSQYGFGLSDLIIRTDDDVLLMIEIKDGNKSPSRRRLTPMQRKVAEDFGDLFLVAKDGISARLICLPPFASTRANYSGINYLKETEQ